jgi:threonine dehydrogenase-like Zn-dependent dehydrogenase
MRVTMIGAGYVGLVSGACFADFGHHVTCVDKDAGRIAALRRGEIPIFEPGLVDLVATNIQQGRLEFSVEASGIGDADAVFIAVGTPLRRGDGHADLSYIQLWGGARDRATFVPHGYRDYEIDRSGRHRRRDRAHSAGRTARCRDAGRFQSGILA